MGKKELVEDSKTTESIDSVEATLSTKVETLPEKGAMGLKEVLNKEKKVSSEVVVQSDKSVEVVKPKAKELEPGQITVTVHKARVIEKKGMFGKDDTLGHKVMDINSVVKQKKLLNQWIPLDNCKSGEILLSAEFIPIADIQKSKQIEKPKASEASLQKSEDIEKSLAPKISKDDLKQIEPKTEESFEVQVSAVKRLWRNQKQLNRKR